MLLDNENIILFPEGGRSYDGAMMELKNGILAANILAQHRDPNHQYTYMPCAISYEHLPEIDWFGLLEKGRELRKTAKDYLGKLYANTLYYGSDCIAFAKFLAAHKFGITYGNVIMDYDTPVKVSDIVDVAKEYAPHARNEFFAHKKAMQIVGEEMQKRLFRLYRILPMHVVADTIRDRQSARVDDLLGAAADICAILRKDGRNCKSLVPLSSRDIVEKGIAQLSKVNAVRVTGKTVRVRNRKILRYYAATIDTN
jgi:glycerol-3-phosphate O-acyltransferase